MSDLPITWPQIRWLLDKGVPHTTISRCAHLRTVGSAIAFYEETDDDVVFWSPRSGELIADRGRAFALGGSEICASSGVFDHLRIFANALDWLRADGRGLVVIDWRQLFDRLRDVPKIAVDEQVLHLYRRYIRPDTPDLSVLRPEWRAAA